ncbi:opioid-binding protein/cell adhesion molecule homolog isoform X2 [Vespula pensylvanica]|uniref:opioid-binding protein/cell adhesion molecule homolog isoform X2 n=1 Tax=Vespula pensylvanica TaxID=30213 RepID=UPI001CBA1450|nr:opioid-binding protein/cell adhesion molecule homolog isoform X2 [Vespula pensylvanica]XP_050862403.1 opioid-binding protein/cell adhesion molecule homolog isoform X2 [Vespula vulgaris]
MGIRADRSVISTIVENRRRKRARKADCEELPRFGKPLNNLTISVGREAIFTCIVENLGPYKVAWLRVDTQTILTIANHVITKNHRITVTHSGHRTWSLHIKDTKETDRGWYMCQVNTDPMSSITGFLEIVVPPDILDYPTSTDMEVREGSNVTLRCAATGTPKPTVTWRREAGGTITLSNWHEASIEGSYLEITDVTRLHMGPYLCIASNGVPPTVSKRIVLIVHFPPMVWIEKQLVGAYEGKVLVLECQSEAYPKPISYWTRPTNETITNDNHYEVETISKGYKGYKMTMRLTIKSVRVQDFGSFRCISTNSLGETESKIKLYRIDRPPTTRRPGTRRDSKKSWKVDHSNEKKAAGMRDEPISKGNYDSGEEQTDFQSATASSSFQRHIFANLGITVFIGIIVSGLST